MGDAEGTVWGRSSPDNDSGVAISVCNKLFLEKSGRSWVASGSNGADKIAPSMRQKVNVSSNVRLQVGQRFIGSFQGNF